MSSHEKDAPLQDSSEGPILFSIKNIHISEMNQKR